MRDDAVGAERLEESKRRKGEVASGPDVVMGHSSSSCGPEVESFEVHVPRGPRRTAEDPGLLRLQDLAESRLDQSVHGETMRLGGVAM